MLFYLCVFKIQKSVCALLFQNNDAVDVLTLQANIFCFTVHGCKVPAKLNMCKVQIFVPRTRSNQASGLTGVGWLFLSCSWLLWFALVLRLFLGWFVCF